MIMARSQPQAYQRARVGYGLRLPAMIGLIAPHRFFTGLIPLTGRFPTQVVLADQRLLDGLRPLGVNFLLAPRGRLPFAVLARVRVLRFAVVSRGGRTRFRVLLCRRMRCRMKLGRRGRACSGVLRGSLRMCLRVRCRGVRRLSLRAAVRLRAGSRPLPKRCARRSAGTHQGQSASRAQPSSYFRAMLPLRFQRQPSDLILPESNSGIPDSGITRFRGRIPPQHQNRKLSACSSALPQQGLCDSKLTDQNCR